MILNMTTTLLMGMNALLIEKKKSRILNVKRDLTSS